MDNVVTTPADYSIPSNRVRFMGMDFDPLDTDGTIRALLNHANGGFAFTYLVTPNVDHMVRLSKEPELKAYYEPAGINVCDSRILELLAKVDGKFLPAAPGADIVDKLVREYISPNERVVLIGGNVEMLEALSRDFGLTNIAWHDPPMGLRKNPEAVRKAAEFVRDNTERFAFLCVGSPQQEMIALETQRMGGGKGVGLCCGASFEFLTGKVTRAPKWMRENRLEWLHRLISEPKRLWRRYLVDGPKILRIWWSHRND